ncbi:MAG: hypothetical protein KHX62_01725 [Firmicutes bacterium]|nr:hypothetical protein [Bacillota bacterium]
MKPNKRSSRLLALALSLVLSLSLSLPALAAGEDGIIYIHTAKDLCALSDSCAYDAWSRGKTVLLTADISLRGVDFEPIASFSGTFNGGGHTISGLTLTKSLSPAGLFLTLERGAFVHALKVEGQVAPGGTKEFVGGIAGRSYGTIEECSFFGVVKGESAVGGIVGRNEAGGLVANCTVSGSVSANRYTGGIAGYNLGTLRACINSASVNTANVDPTLSLDDLSIDPASSLTDLVSVGAAESRNATSDTGGVAGYSSGSLLSCINRGAVGYPHFGYNVGGGAGRSDGFMDFCSNYGMIYGRKDVGGIVGQMEPYLHLSLRDDLIARLRAELDKLNALVSSTLDDVDSTNDHISSRLDSVSAYTNAAVDDADSLAGQTTDFIDKNIGTVNELVDRADDVMDALPDILKALEAAEDSMGDAVDALEQCNKDLTMSAADRAELSRFSNDLQQQSKALAALTDELRGYIESDDVNSALACLVNVADVLSAMASDMSGITGLLTDYLQTAVPKAHEDIQRALRALDGTSGSLGSALRQARKLIEEFNERDELTFYPLGEGYQSTLDSLFSNLRSTMNELDGLSDEVSADGTTLTADLRAVNDQMNAVVNLCLDIFVDMTDADASDIFEDTSDENIDAVTFGKVRGCTNYGAVDADLNVGGIAGAMAIEYELDPEGDQKESSSVFDRVYETKAVVQHCVNRGSISGKKDCIGGIVGEMDLGIVLSCEAYGSARSETGSYVGGIAGLSSAGIRSSWAKLTLSGKSSVGGIVGSGSEDTSSSAGSGCTVTDCRSLVVVEDCDQFSGAISGRDLGVFRGNYFVSDVLRGIDRRSLSGQAEPMDYAAFCALGSVPEDFLSFTLRFVCDGRTLKTLRFDYGDSFDFSVFPSLTEQSGSYPVWDRTDLTDLRFDTVVTAEYTAYRASLQSDAQRADGRSVFFVEGEFNETDSLTAAAQTPDPGAFPQLADNRRTALKNYFSFLSERTLPAMTVYRSVAEQWELSFPRDALAEHTIRYLSPEEVSMDHCAVFVRRSDGSWQPVETTSMGSYLLFTAEGENVQLAVLTTAAVWWLWAIFLALIAAAVFFIVRVVHRKRRKKTVKSGKKENGAAG